MKPTTETHTSHTPGPWIIERDLSGAPCISPKDLAEPYSVATCNGPRAEANARLLAAAPELVAALRELERLTSSYLRGELVVFPVAILHQARAAIAKAEGRA